MQINTEIEKEFPWGAGREWKDRTVAIASKIPPGASVIDLGGGFGHLTKYTFLRSYVSIDLKPWTDATVVANFNAGEYPDVEKANIVVAQGILEYIDYKERFLNAAQKYASTLLLTYRREGQEKVRKMIPKCGWRIVYEEQVKPMGQALFYCEKI